MPKRFSTLRVSMVCNAGTSTRNSECSGLKGILVVDCRVESELLGAVCGEKTGVGVRGRAVWRVEQAVGNCYVSARIGRWAIYPEETRP